ncbi:rhodanese-like domain-containing protein [Anaerocolumna sp. AGMB13025]|uniref:rhodanese-like domain-containing protein n=1 Tax=Anaerocolumna sp. AGMB13025 TaxID=3039116 RepID=UPI00241C144D|nr:rhodanese-like domain-containing protein [Anaerocolumna sp. AGMB13025]WFR58849.1 rhodanese-like domain-containing protein [Anaerocolumna sp. AGMB13025]
MKNMIVQSEDQVTTEEFVRMIIKSSKVNLEETGDTWSSGYMEYALQMGIIEDYDMSNTSKPIERRSAARIVHEALLTEFREKDEYEWSAAENLKDLYSCHSCVMHIAQVYVKGIMLGRDNNVFDVKGCITREEASAILARMLDPEQRIPQIMENKVQSKKLSPEKAWELLRNESNAKLIDVRTKEEYNLGHIKDSICIPLLDISNNPYSVCERKDTPVILYCQKGYKSSVAAQLLIDAGYSRIYSIPGIEEYWYDLII